MGRKNLIVEFDEVTVKISEMKLWVVTKTHPTPHHRFRLSVLNFKGERKFYENVVICGSYDDFEFKGSAERYIEMVLHRMNKKDPDLILHSFDDRENFDKFLVEFEKTLTTMLDNEPPPLCQLF